MRLTGRRETSGAEVESWLQPVQTTTAPSGSDPRRLRVHLWIAAGCVLLGLLAGLMLGQGAAKNANDEPRGAELTEIEPTPALESPDIESTDQPIATLVSTSPDVVWNNLHSAPRTPGSGLSKGWLRLDSGIVELRFRSRATVLLKGPAAFGIDSPLRGYLEYGTVGVHVPDGARNFAIGTAAMEVVDLGTRFNLKIDRNSGEAAVEVVEGLVDLHLDGEGALRRIQSLPAGRSAVVSTGGEVVSITGEPIDPRHQNTSRLLAHWKLDDAFDDDRVADSSGHGLHGTFKGGNRATSLNGKVGGALDPGETGFVDLSQHVRVLTGPPAFTLTAWVRDPGHLGHVVFSVTDGTTLDRVQFGVLSNMLYYGWQKGRQSVQSDADQFDFVAARVGEWQRGRWYQIGVSVSGGTLILYRDGQAVITPQSFGKLLGTRVRAPIDIARPKYACLGDLMLSDRATGHFLDAPIDDVQFYGQALDEQAIRFLFDHPGQTYSGRGPSRAPSHE
ncbi:MAG: LamG-like jellyroll fold domain-containing protein [Planctomycetaceae bacterium]